MTMDKSLLDYQIREIVIIAWYSVALASILAVIYEANNHIKARKLYVKTCCREVLSSNEVTPGVYRFKRNRKYAPPRFPKAPKAEEVQPVEIQTLPVPTKPITKPVKARKSKKKSSAAATTRVESTLIQTVADVPKAQRRPVLRRDELLLHDVMCKRVYSHL